MSSIQQQDSIKYFGSYDKVDVKNEEYNVYFYDRIAKIRIPLGKAYSEDEAKLMLGKEQYNFYSENKILLPKYINTSPYCGKSEEYKGNQYFTLRIPHPCKTKRDGTRNTVIHIGYFTTIQDAIWAKKNLVSRLVE